MALEMIEQQYALWAGWRREDKEGQPPMARWITLSRDGDLVLHCSPVSAAQVLRRLLWDEVDSVVMTTGCPAESASASMRASPNCALWRASRSAGLIVVRFMVPPSRSSPRPRASGWFVGGYSR